MTRKTRPIGMDSSTPNKDKKYLYKDVWGRWGHSSPTTHNTLRVGGGVSTTHNTLCVGGGVSTTHNTLRVGGGVSRIRIHTELTDLHYLSGSTLFWVGVKRSVTNTRAS